MVPSSPWWAPPGRASSPAWPTPRWGCKESCRCVRHYRTSPASTVSGSSNACSPALRSRHTQRCSPVSASSSHSRLSPHCPSCPAMLHSWPSVRAHSWQQPHLSATTPASHLHTPTCTAQLTRNTSNSPIQWRAAVALARPARLLCRQGRRGELGAGGGQRCEKEQLHHPTQFCTAGCTPLLDGSDSALPRPAPLHRWNRFVSSPSQQPRNVYTGRCADFSRSWGSTYRYSSGFVGIVKHRLLIPYKWA